MFMHFWNIKPKSVSLLSVAYYLWPYFISCLSLSSSETINLNNRDKENCHSMLVKSKYPAAKLPGLNPVSSISYVTLGKII